MNPLTIRAKSLPDATVLFPLRVRIYRVKAYNFQGGKNAMISFILINNPYIRGIESVVNHRHFKKNYYCCFLSPSLKPRRWRCTSEFLIVHVEVILIVPVEVILIVPVEVILIVPVEVILIVPV